MTDSFYVLEGDSAAEAVRVVPSELTRGPWDRNSQHAGPASALLARAIELCEPRDGTRVARVTVEILKPLPIEPLTLNAQIVRPGKSVELIEASLEGAHGELARARGWRLAETDITADWEQDDPPPGRQDAEALEFFPTGEAVGWHTAMEIVFARGRFLEPGPATVWMRPRVALVEGESITPLQRVMLAADGGNGVSAPLPWDRFIFINTDLTVHLLRPPEGEWVCLDSVTHVEGTGMTDTALWDERGRVGRAAQTLLVRARS
ncbi:MAG TPA: thioesterase family protein [Thermoleophilaceae bacterium]|nr:thioesterase family protein [Thermoleophilaceae bacterium]